MIRTSLVLCAVALPLAGCSSWSTSNVRQNPPETAMAPVAPSQVQVSEGDLAGQYTVITDLKVSVNKTTAFHPSPTREAVIVKLQEEAASVGANAVINAKISNIQVSAFSWGARTGTGTAVRVGK